MGATGGKWNRWNVEVAGMRGCYGAAVGTENLDAWLCTLDVDDGGFVDFGEMVSGAGVSD
jgi:hypothetical protein